MPGGGGAACTVSTVLPVKLFIAAVIVELPALFAVASPAALMVAMLVLDDVQATSDVMSCVLLSEYVPVALNCCPLPAVRVGFAGVTAIDTSVAGETVNVVLPLMPFSVAEMVEVPAALPVAIPVLVIVAVEVLDDAQVTCEVTFCVLESE